MRFLLILMVIVSAALTSCGYHLRTLQSTPKIVSIDMSTQNIALQQAINNELDLLGFKTTHNRPADIYIHDINYRQYDFAGLLTEVRLVASVNVSYQLADKKQTYTLSAERSYQYNKASVANLDKQSLRVKSWLQQDLAKKISEQYYALSTEQPTKPTHQ